ncbi:MAG: beta-lactamase family protein [Blastocatellia bacterium]|nr:beta-lactamase family protein [Blastocatellia bacterium]MBL8192866.1 beta-lactamase family protein [Blastocatellia bacterium]MBN8722028.1 beta-lactamase family protein [Acidobacteriota bacterium]
MKFFLLLIINIIFIFLFVSCREGQFIDNKTNTETKINSKNLIELDDKELLKITTKIDKLLSKSVKENEPGLAILVVKDSRVIYRKGYGIANLENETPVKGDTIFYTASVSKQFTAMAIMILAEAGKLSYDDPLTKFFPNFPDYAKKITVKHLLYHTSGLSDYIETFKDKENLTDSVAITKKAIEILAKQKEPDFEAGTKHEYSNSGYLVLAGIVEQASGQDFPTFVKEKIFQPLEMKESSVITTSKDLPEKLARGYKLKNSNYKDVEFGKSSLDLCYGDGGILTSVQDMYKWDQALYTEKLVKANTLKLAFSAGTLGNGEKIDYSDGWGYGFGWAIGDIAGQELITHSGSWYGWATVIARVPSKNLSVVIFANTDEIDVSDISLKIAKMFLK